MTPDGVMATPIWALRTLLHELPTIEAEQIQRYATAVLLPHLDPHDRRAMLRQLADYTAPAITPSPEPSEHDPDKAAAWFATRGVRVSNA